MNYNPIDKKLKQLRIESFVWIIYAGIIILSLYSNSLEEKYFLYNDIKSKDDYRKTMIFIFTILIIVYLYFLSDSYNELRELNLFDTSKKKKLTYLSFLGSLLIFISGLIFLYIAIKDEDIDVELAFN